MVFTPFLAAVLVSVPLYVLCQLFFAGTKPASTPWGPSGRVGVLAAMSSAYKNTIDVNKTLALCSQMATGQTSGVAISTMIDGVIVLLPLRHLRWLSSLPEDMLSMLAFHQERLQLSYTIPAATLGDPILTKLLVKLLTRRTKGTISEAHEEIMAICSKAPFVATGEWHSVCLSTVVLRMVTATTNKMLVGLPLCRDKEFLGLQSSYTHSVLPSAMFIRVFPRILRPLVGRLVLMMRTRLFATRLRRMLTPILRKLISERNEASEQTNKGKSFASWWVQEAAGDIDNANGNSLALNPETLATVIIQLNFVGTHSTSLVTTNVLYHILAFSHVNALIEELRAEIVQATGNGSGPWSLACLERMRLLDSIVRETLRLMPLDSIAMSRQLTKDIVTPDGLHLTAGTNVCLPGVLANYDEACYPNATVWDPYRFVKSTDTTSTISENFVSFGYGVHSCPGRWFAAAEIKIIIAYLLTNYDMEPMSSVPKSFRLGTMVIPSLSQRVNIRAI